jgi:predicted dehydrogenase
MVKVALLSASHIHTPGFVKKMKERPGVQVVGIYEPDTAIAQKYAAELNAPIVENPQKLIDDKSIDAAVIVGTTAQHDDLVVPAAKAGKHLFVEKPLAVSSLQANKMYRAIKDAGVIYQTGHFMRTDPRFVFVKQQVDAGNFGTITRVRATNCHGASLAGWFDKDWRWFWDIAEAGGGGFYDLGCHSLDMLIWIFGPVASATGALGGKTIRYPNIDEYGEALLRFSSGITGSLAAGWADKANPNILEITGTEGHLHIHNGIIYYHSEKSKIPSADGKSALDNKHLAPAGTHPFDLFFDVLEGNADKAELIPIEQSLAVAKTMESIYLGNRIGSWVNIV